MLALTNAFRCCLPLLREPWAIALVGRMEEAHRCIEASSYLAAVILCGSVLEGMCLGQLAHRFIPDRHTARIGFQVAVAAAEELVAAEVGLANTKAGA